MTSQHQLDEIVNWQSYPLDDEALSTRLRSQLDEEGVICLDNFLQDPVIDALVKEAEAASHLAYYTASTHNVYLTKPDSDLPETHIFNRQLISSKGCITTDQVPPD